MKLVEGQDIIIVGQQPWDTEIGSNCKNIALEFSKHNRVLYVNAPLDRRTVLKRASEPQIKKRLSSLKDQDQRLEQVQSNLWVYHPDVILESINWIKLGPLFDILNKYNNRQFGNSIKRAIDMLKFKDFFLFNDNDIFRCFYLKELLNPTASIYYSRDNMIATDYWRFHGLRLEPKLIAKSDICVANSAYLAAQCKIYNPNSWDIGQGCEVDIYLEENGDTPKDIAGIRTPIIGYVGALTTMRLDIEILNYIASTRPDWNVVLVGPEDDAFKVSKLHKMENVHFLGPKDPMELPAYIHAFSVCINPQVVNDLTIGNYPRKIDEYLASGKPVVATRTGAMTIFEDHTYLADTKQDYVTLIEQALTDDNQERAADRKAFASSHTWERSVGEIYRYIASLSNV